MTVQHRPLLSFVALGMIDVAALAVVLVRMVVR